MGESEPLRKSPKHISHSARDTLERCPRSYFLRYFTRAPRRPAVWSVGGSAVHEATEQWDLAYVVSGEDPGWTAASVLDAWEASFDKLRTEAQAAEPDETKWGQGGTEGADVWRQMGVGLVQAYIDWRLRSNWEIAVVGGDVPAIELDVSGYLPGCPVEIKAYIDRVMWDPLFEQYVIPDIKGLAVDTPLVTPQGWTTMGEVSVGDEVFGPDGRPCKVTAKSSTKAIGCYRVTFDDATSIVCDEEHLWETGLAGVPDSVAVREVREIANTLFSKRGQRQHVIEMPLELELPAADLPVDPYVLGVWLGDGKHTDGSICNPEGEIRRRIEGLGYKVGAPWSGGGACPSWTIYRIRKHLRALDVLGNKHVPQAYLRGSASQRLELLRGLMDTDGCFNRKRKEVCFTQKREQIARSVHELALSLGERATINPIVRTGFGVTGTYWEVKWRPSVNPFRLSRKADQVLPPPTRSRRRLIVSAEKVDTVPTQCIAVNSPDRMYLAGRQMVPTHNSGKKPPTEAAQFEVYKALLEVKHGIKAKLGVHFLNRRATVGKPFDLSEVTPEGVGKEFGEAWVRMQGHRNSRSWPATKEGCFICDLQASCYEIGGPLAAQFDPNHPKHPDYRGTEPPPF